MVDLFFKLFSKGDQLKVKLANLKFSKKWRWTLVFSIWGVSNREKGLLRLHTS